MSGAMRAFRGLGEAVAVVEVTMAELVDSGNIISRGGSTRVNRKQFREGTTRMWGSKGRDTGRLTEKRVGKETYAPTPRPKGKKRAEGQDEHSRSNILQNGGEGCQGRNDNMCEEADSGK
jgi:hypothetical protein